jgi:CRISPR/Cas system CSM-associated protein Csm3 (group 7 of RAMP superfamily)
MDIQIPLEIDPILVMDNSPLRVATGFGKGLLDRTVVRRRRLTMPSQGEAVDDVYLPASSFKGRLRDTCEQLARAMGLSLCDPPIPEKMCGSIRKDRSKHCIACRIFGTPGQPSGLLFHDAVLSPDLADALIFEPSQDEKAYHGPVSFAQTVERTQAQINRRYGVAEPRHLYTSEFATAGLLFETRISGYLQATPFEDGPGSYELTLLLAGLSMVDAFGGGRSMGSGSAQISLPESLLWNGESLSCTDILENVERLKNYPGKGLKGGE